MRPLALLWLAVVSVLLTVPVRADYVHGESIQPLANGDDIIIDHRHIYTSIAYGMLDAMDPFADRDAFFSQTWLCGSLARNIEQHTAEPRLSMLDETYGILTNMQFLTEPLTDLGDPVQAVQNDFHAYADQIGATLGVPVTLQWNVIDHGTTLYAVYGGIVPGDPPTIVDGTAHVTLYEVNATLSAGVPEPRSLLLCSASGLVCLASSLWRRRGGSRQLTPSVQ